MKNPNRYPASLSVDYPEKLNRWTTFFRLIMLIPIFIIIMLLTNGFGGMDFRANGHEGANWQYVASGLVILPLVLMILFRKKYPRWWFDWNLALTRFCTRVEVYFALLRDEYPSTDEEQAVHLAIDYPDAAKDLKRGMPLVKWILAIPHYISLIVLCIAALVCIIIAWFAILFIGRYPQRLFNFVVGTIRWGLRVAAYAFLLTTDRYPPFSLST